MLKIPETNQLSVNREYREHTMSLLKIEHLRKEYPGVTPLTDVNLEVNKGEIISIIGPSGTGKSTLLKCINQLVQPTSGTIIFNGEDITAPGCDISRVRRKMGMVFQYFNLFNNLNVIDNVTAAPVDLLKKPVDDAYIEGMDLLKRVGLAEKSKAFPDELSGGQRQRVAIARAIAMKPDILLFDEPTSALDPTMIGEVLIVIRNLAKEGMTMLIVTHEMNFARYISTRILYMDEGIIYEDGTPEQIFDHPQKEKTRQFIRQLKILQIEINSADFDFPGVQSRIQRFGKDNLLSPHEIYDLQLVFEETVMQGIIKHIEDTHAGYPVRITIEHSDIDDTSVFSATYGGEKFDPLNDADELSAMIIRNIASEVNYSRGTGNKLEIKLLSRKKK